MDLDAGVITGTTGASGGGGGGGGAPLDDLFISRGEEGLSISAGGGARCTSFTTGGGGWSRWLSIWLV